MAKLRPRNHAGVKLTPFPGGVDTPRQINEKFPIISASGETGVELGGIHAAQVRTQPAVDHLARERGGVVAEQREQRRPPEPCA